MTETVTNNEANLAAELQRLKVENAKLRAEKEKPKGISMKVSAKGAISVYGMGRFPVTLYASQWERILDMADNMKLFIEANEADLVRKD